MAGALIIRVNGDKSEQVAYFNNEYLDNNKRYKENIKPWKMRKKN